MNINPSSLRILLARSMTMLLFAAFVSVIHPPLARSADSSVTEVPVPCTPDSKAKSGTGFLRKCSEVINQSSNPNAPKGMIQLLDTQVKKIIDDPAQSLYRGGFNDPISGTMRTGRPVCDLMPNEFNSNTPEVTKNHLGESCGNPAHFVIQTHKGGFDATWQFGGQYGTREYAYLWGLKVQAKVCYWQQVRNEILNDRKIKVSPYCDAQAKALMNSMNQSQQAVTALVKQMGNTSNISEIWKCDPKEFGTNGTKFNSSVPIQAAEKLCEARTDIENAYLNFAMCEVKERSDQAFRHFAWNADSFLDRLKVEVAGHVKQACSHSCDGCKSYSCCNARATQCTNATYPVALQNYMQSYVAQVPNNGNCSLGQ